MAPVFTSSVTKKLVLQYVMENIEIGKRSKDLQEVLLIGKTYRIWLLALTHFFDTPVSGNAIKAFSKN